MLYKRQLKITRDKGEEEYIYYVAKHYSEDFDCDMYNVGIRCNGKVKEINDFSPDEDEAVRLCDYLYQENVSINNLFSRSEEFIVLL